MTYFSKRILLLGTFIAILSPNLSEAAKQQVPAKLTCGPNTANPKGLPAFQTNMKFVLSGDQIEAKRSFHSNGGGTEAFKGTVSSSGAMLISGVGQEKKGGAWKYEFSGTRSDKGDTVVRGQRTNTAGIVGSRDCEIVFFKPRSL